MIRFILSRVLCATLTVGMVSCAPGGTNTTGTTASVAPVGSFAADGSDANFDSAGEGLIEAGEFAGGLSETLGKVSEAFGESNPALKTGLAIAGIALNFAAGLMDAIAVGRATKNPGKAILAFGKGMLGIFAPSGPSAGEQMIMAQITQLQTAMNAGFAATKDAILQQSTLLQGIINAFNLSAKSDTADAQIAVIDYAYNNLVIDGQNTNATGNELQTAIQSKVTKFMNAGSNGFFGLSQAVSQLKITWGLQTNYTGSLGWSMVGVTPAKGGSAAVGFLGSVATQCQNSNIYPTIMGIPYLNKALTPIPAFGDAAFTAVMHYASPTLMALAKAAVVVGIVNSVQGANQQNANTVQLLKDIQILTQYLAGFGTKLNADGSPTYKSLMGDIVAQAGNLVASCFEGMRDSGYNWAIFPTPYSSGYNAINGADTGAILLFNESNQVQIPLLACASNNCEFTGGPSDPGGGIISRIKGWANGGYPIYLRNWSGNNFFGTSFNTVTGEAWGELVTGPNQQLCVSKPGVTTVCFPFPKTDASQWYRNKLLTVLGCGTGYTYQAPNCVRDPAVPLPDLLATTFSN